MEAKRKADEVGDGDTIKKARGELIAVDGKGGKNQQLIAGPKRTSSLTAPNMQLSGHGAEVFSVKFNNSGSHLASSSFDKSIFLWETFGECKNTAVLKGHNNAVLECQWSADSNVIFSASADKSAAAFDVHTTERVKKFNGHQQCVNSVSASRLTPSLLVSGSDDGTAKMWDLRARTATTTLPNKFPVLAVQYHEAASQVFVAGIDSYIQGWDLRKNGVVMTLTGHTDAVTGLALSADGSYLLSNSMDNLLRAWDIRPYVSTPDRCVKIFQGVVHLLRCAWSPDGLRVTAGSGDRLVNVWDTTSRQLIYRLPGHSGSVNEVAFHPKEPIIASAASDRCIYLGELDA